MKLKISPTPKEYTADKAAVLIDTDDHDEPILIGCPNATARAREIKRAVNFHKSLVAILTPFKSSEMGNMLIDMVVSNPPANASPDTIAKATTRITELVRAIDLILKGVEMSEERDRHDPHTS